MLGRKAGLWVVLLGLLAFLSGCKAESGAVETTETAVPVIVARAEMGLLSRGDLLSGMVAPRTEINLVPKMGGRVATVTAEAGDRVRAGQTVVRLEATELQAAVAQAEAGLAMARAGGEQSRLAVVQARTGEEQARIALDQAQAAYDLAQSNYERGRFLLEQGAIPQAEFEQRFQEPYNRARGGLEQARVGIEQARVMLEQAVNNYEQALPAQAAQAEAALALARANYANSIINSPLNGIVAARHIEPGAMAAPSMPVLTIIDIDHVRVEVQVSEKLVNRLQSGQEVPVRIGAVAAEPFNGKIVSVAPAADPRTRTYTVKVELPNPEHWLKPGMFAEVDFGTADGENVLVPRDAVFQRGGVDAVFVYAAGRVNLREVVTGASDGRLVAVLAGLAAGEMVVTSGQDALKDGMAVEVPGLEVEQ